MNRANSFILYMYRTKYIFCALFDIEIPEYLFNVDVLCIFVKVVYTAYTFKYNQVSLTLLLVSSVTVIAWQLHNMDIYHNIFVGKKHTL